MVTLILRYGDLDTLKETICTHFDGGVKQTSVSLAGWYNTQEKVASLIAMVAPIWLNQNIAPEPGHKHTFNRPAVNVSIAYHRETKNSIRRESTAMSTSCQGRRDMDASTSASMTVHAG